MDRATVNARLDWLAAQRGDVVNGLPPALWAEALGNADRELLHRAALLAVRELVLQEWVDRRKEDHRPQKALEAAEAYMADPSPENLLTVKACAKACTAARSETFGYEHRVAEAARSVAWAAGAKDAQHIFEALGSIEAELLARIALTSEYHKGPAQRRALLDVVRKVLAPPEPVVEQKASLPPGPPVPYSADSHFELGQRIIHKKFGDIVVTSVGETWIEVELPDASKKRLAHKP